MRSSQRSRRIEIYTRHPILRAKVTTICTRSLIYLPHPSRSPTSTSTPNIWHKASPIVLTLISIARLDSRVRPSPRVLWNSQAILMGLHRSWALSYQCRQKRLNSSIRSKISMKMFWALLQWTSQAHFTSMQSNQDRIIRRDELPNELLMWVWRTWMQITASYWRFISIVGHWLPTQTSC